jgi:hypothetical protein
MMATWSRPVSVRSVGDTSIVSRRRHREGGEFGGDGRGQTVGRVGAAFGERRRARRASCGLRDLGGEVSMRSASLSSSTSLELPDSR